jgi:uncharacterized membrane protein YkgB
VASAGSSAGWILAIRDVARNALLSRHDAVVLVPPLGDINHGFPFLSGAGRLVIKDAIMMGAALVVMADSAKAGLRKQQPPALDWQ